MIEVRRNHREEITEVRHPPWEEMLSGLHLSSTAKAKCMSHTRTAHAGVDHTKSGITYMGFLMNNSQTELEMQKKMLTVMGLLMNVQKKTQKAHTQRTLGWG